jgi:hypothetical protein
MASESREGLKAKRHALYCSIADALQHSGEASPAVLDRLQAVLEAEACLSCIDGDADSLVQTPGSDAYDATTDSYRIGAPAAAHARSAAVGRHLPSLSHCITSTPAPGPAVAALQQLKEELAQRVHQSVIQQQHQPQHKPRQSKVCVSMTHSHSPLASRDAQSCLVSASASAVWPSVTCW